MGKFLVQSLSGGSKDSSEAGRAFHSLGFSRIKEDVFADRKYGISISSFDNEVQTLAKQYQLPDHIVGIIKRGKLAEKNTIYVKEFKYRMGSGKVMFGSFATVRNDDSIDIAYSLFQAEFQLTPERIEHVRKRRKKFFGIPVGKRKKVRVEYRARELSEKSLEAYDSYFKSQAVQGYQKKFIHDEL